jgi:hypothetical protein
MLARLARAFVPHDRFLSIVVWHEAVIEAARAEHLAIMRRKTAEPHHTAVFFDPPMQLHQLPNEATGQQTDLVEFQHQPVGEVLSQDVPNPFCQRRHFGFGRIKLRNPHHKPIGAAFNLQLTTGSYCQHNVSPYTL